MSNRLVVKCSPKAHQQVELLFPKSGQVVTVFVSLDRIEELDPSNASVLSLIPACSVSEESIKPSLR